MHLCNNTLFSPHDPLGYSIENEVAFSLNCVPNLLKIITFSIYLFIFFSFFLLGFEGLRRDTVVHGVKWNPTKRRLMFLILCSAGHVGCFTIFLAGRSSSRGKYALFPLLYGPLWLIATDSVRSWYTASVMIQKNGQILPESNIKLLNLIYYSFYVFQIVGYITLWLILPMVFFDDPWILNWIYISGYLLTATICLFTATYGFKIAHSLVSVITQDFQDKTVTTFVSQYKALLVKMKVASAVIAPMFVLIIWVPLTQTDTNPGLEYFFYFEFFASVPVRILAVSGMMKVAFNAVDRDLTSSSTDVEAKTRQSKDFSHSPEELTAQNTTTEVDKN